MRERLTLGCTSFSYDLSTSIHLHEKVTDQLEINPTDSWTSSDLSALHVLQTLKFYSGLSTKNFIDLKVKDFAHTLSERLDGNGDCDALKTVFHACPVLKIFAQREALAPNPIYQSESRSNGWSSED